MMSSFEDSNVSRTDSPFASHSTPAGHSTIGGIHFIKQQHLKMNLVDLTSTPVIDENHENNARQNVLFHSEEMLKINSRSEFSEKLTSDEKPVKNLSSEDTVENLISPAVDNSVFLIHHCGDSSFLSPTNLLEDENKEKETIVEESDIAIDLSEEKDPSDGVTEEEQAEQLRLQREREERETQELIWELMRQEQMELYQLQMQFMQNQQQSAAQEGGGGEGMNDEDMRAIQEAMRENNQIIATISRPQPRRSQGGEGEGEGSEENSQEEEEDEDNEEEEEEEEWDYERLLALGQALGDVKTERWRQRSKQIIDSLPVVSFQEISERATSNNNNKNNNQQSENEEKEDEQSVKKMKVESQQQKQQFFEDYRCVICMDEFVCSDSLKLLPCCHYFHISCASGWLADHDNCPSCKKKLIQSPEK
jgi:hypothetical protein